MSVGAEANAPPTSTAAPAAGLDARIARAVPSAIVDEPKKGSRARRPAFAPADGTAAATAELSAFYDGLAARFGEASPSASGYVSDYAFARQRALVLDVVGGAPGPLVDLGCGAGLVTLPLVESGRRVVGVDFNAEACRRAGRHGLAVVRGDAFRTPLADGAANVVLNVGFAQQYGAEAIERLLGEAARVLRPGGRLVIVWANRAALVRRAVFWCLRFLDALRGRAAPPLFSHAPAEMRAAAGRAALALDRMFAVSLSARRRWRADGPLARLIGTTFVAVLRRPGEPAPPGR